MIIINFTPEQAARDLLERLGHPKAQSLSDVDVRELAKVISKARHPVYPLIGWWYAPCCIEDLRLLATAEDLAEALELHSETGGMFFPTLTEALKSLEESDWGDHERAIAAKLIEEHGGG